MQCFIERRGILKAFSNNWEYSLILYQNLTDDIFLKVNFNVISETMLRKLVQLIAQSELILEMEISLLMNEKTQLRYKFCPN